jgi:hypothetical protein
MAVESLSRKLKTLLVATAAIVLLAAVLVGVAYANVRKKVPDEDPYAPIYTDWYGNENWVAFVFYRPPEDVPDTFNIFEFFDFNAYQYPLTVEGFVIYENPGDFVPIQAKLRGLGSVPVWFVSRTDYNSAKGNGLYRAELEELDSLLIGSASFFEETLHPEGHPTMPMKDIVARGTLEDGRAFRLHALWVGGWGQDVVNVNVNVVFR